jgi:Glycosyltransferase family 87
MTTTPPTAESESLTKSKKPFWPRELVLGLLPLLLGFQALVWISYLPSGLHGIAVFRTLYVCGYMTATHQSHDIYDSDKVQNLSEALVPLGHVFNQPMDHPAYEALLFAPLGLLPYRSALIILIIVNIGVFALCLWMLRDSYRVLSDRWKPFAPLLFSAFFPVTYVMTRGADSILLLSLLAGAFVALQGRKDLRAGLLVGLGVFKFQIVLPIALLFLIWKRLRFVLGFGISSALAFSVSVVMVGITGVRQYAGILLGMSLRLRTEADALRYSLSPRTMLNIRGLLSAALEGRCPGWWLQGLILASSLVVVVLVARCRASMPLAIVTAALVSYHLNVPDAVVLIIPIGLCLSSDSAWVVLAALATFIVPLTAIVPTYGFVGAVPILLLLFACLSQQRSAFTFAYAGTDA